MAAIYYPSPIMTNTYKQFLCCCRIGEIEAEQCSTPATLPQAHLAALPSPESLSLQIPHPRGFLGMETSSKLVKVKSIATEM